MLEKIGDFMLAGLAILICAAVLGVVIFGSVAGYKGFKDHRVRKNTCVELLQARDYDNYLKTCRSIDFIHIEAADGQVPLMLLTEEK